MLFTVYSDIYIRMEYDPMYEPTDENVFEVVGRYLDEWKYFYPDSQ